MTGFIVKKAAKGSWWKVSLAVLFLLFYTQAFAQELIINLDRPADWPSVQDNQGNPLGFSLAYTTLPLLNLKIKSTRTHSIDSKSNSINFSQRLGRFPVGSKSTFDIYSHLNYSINQNVDKAWKESLQKSFTAAGTAKTRGSLLQYEIPVKIPKLIQGIIGQGGPSLRVSGFRKINFSGRSAWYDGQRNTATTKQSKFPTLNMEQTSRFTINGTIGSKIKVAIDQDSKRQVDLDNLMQIRHTGEEDEIIQNFDLGNTSLDISGPQLIRYSQRIQGLIGFKSKVRLGGLDMTLIASQEKSANQRTTLPLGAQSEPKIIRDYEYLRRTFYYLGRFQALGHDVNDFQAGDSIVYINVYMGNQNIDQTEGTVPHGLANVSGQFPDPDSGKPGYNIYERVYRRFKFLEPEKYFVERKQFWIKLANPLATNDVLAVYYILKKSNGDIDTVGNLTYQVKDTLDVSQDTTYLLKLIKHNDPKPDYITWDYEWKNVYSLGFTKIDKDALTIDIYKGERGTEDVNNKDLNHLNGIPYVKILGLDRYDLGGDTIPDNKVDLSQVDLYQGLLYFPSLYPFSDTALKPPVDTIYTSSVEPDRIQASQYYIYVKTSQRSSEYSLGRTNILENSETVTLNNRTLTRGVDYNISYETGQITFLTSEASDPTANINIDFEYAPFFAPERKSLFGFRGEKKFDENFKWGLTALFKNEKVTDFRPRVGREPNRSFLWGSDFSISREAPLLTKITDALPLVETNASSQFHLEGEFAQSISNPNLKNKAYIDDFESVIDYTDLGVRRGQWTLASPPVSKNPIRRPKLVWFNPYDQVPVREIWPNKQTKITEDRVNVLVLSLKADTLNPDSAWNGVMRALPQGSYNQTRSKYLELWVQGSKGVLHVDLGQISEDLNNDGVLDTEDKARNGQRDGILDDDEDTGLDNLFSASESGYNSSTNPDPSGDDWNYDNHYVYDRINGTENNRYDPDKGRRPDTEDINYNTGLDIPNNYFEYTIDLDTNLYEVEGSRAISNDSSSWRLYRLPLQDSTVYSKIGNPQFNTIEFARIWISRPDTGLISLKIASSQIVGNRWLDLPILTVDSTADSVTPDERFVVATKNTQENTDYVTPPGVGGRYDRQNNVLEREQSLVLVYENLKPLHIAQAYRILFNAENYTNYQSIKMFVHGPNQTGNIQFFYRLGQDSLNFYEYHTNLYPGWDDRNQVDFDFAEATGLKNYLLTQTAGQPNAVLDTTAGNYRVRGNPNLAALKYFSAGVINLDTVSTSPISGEVWVDEMVASDVRKKPGLAKRFSGSANFGDLATVSGGFNQQDSEFHSLLEKVGKGYTSTNQNLNLNLTLSKFLPPGWGVKLPLNLSWSKSTELPRLKRGSDIIVPEELRDQEKTESVSKNLSFNPSFNKNTKNWLWNLTLNRISTSYSRYHTESRSPLTPVSNTDRYGLGLGYDLSSKSEHTVKVFGWMQSIKFLKKLSESKMSYLPTTLRFKADIQRYKSYSENNAGTATSTFTRDLTGNMQMRWNLFSSLVTDYQMTTKRDLRNDANIKFALLPRKAKLGIEKDFLQTLNTSFTPKIFSFLDHSFNYDVQYHENLDPLQYHGTRRVDNGNRLSATGSFRWQKLLEKIPIGGKVSKDEKKQTKKPKFGTPEWFWQTLGNIKQNLEPLSFTYTREKAFTKSGLTGRPSLAYQFGLADNTGVNRSDSISAQASSQDAESFKKGYTFRTGARLGGGIASDISYSYGEGVNRGSTEPILSKSTSFPEFRLTWTGLEKFQLFKKYVTSSSYSFGYTHKVDETQNDNTGEKYSRLTTKRFSPLVNLTLNWKKGIQTNIKIDKGTTKREDLRQTGSQGVAIDYDRTVNITSSYSFRSVKGINIPILGKLKVQNNMSISGAITMRKLQSRSKVKGQDFNLNRDEREFNFSTTASYGFSSQVNGGFSAKWIDNNNKKTKINYHVRELGIFIELKF